MRRDMAAHASIIGSRLAALPKPNQHVNKKSRPPDEQGGHEPVTKLNDMIDLIAMGGSVGRLAQKLVISARLFILAQVFLGQFLMRLDRHPAMTPQMKTKRADP